jgi:hypothetical protein
VLPNRIHHKGPQSSICSLEIIQICNIGWKLRPIAHGKSPSPNRTELFYRHKLKKTASCFFFFILTVINHQKFYLVLVLHTRHGNGRRSVHPFPKGEEGIGILFIYETPFLIGLDRNKTPENNSGSSHMDQAASPSHTSC